MIAAMLAIAVTLSPALEAWKKEIEEKGKTPLAVAEVEYSKESNELRLGGQVEKRELFADYLRQEEFVKQFMLMYGVMLHHKSPTGDAYLVMLNGARKEDWKENEEAVLGHEFGHAWIKAQGYPAPIFQNNKWACLSIHTGDIAQHILIRGEMQKRGIEYKKFWLEGMDKTAEDLEKRGAPPDDDRCARARMVAQIADVRLGLEKGEWAGQARFEAAVKKAFPEVERTAGEVVEYLRTHDVRDKDAHREALKVVFARLKDLAYGRTKDYILENRWVKRTLAAD